MLPETEGTFSTVFISDVVFGLAGMCAFVGGVRSVGRDVLMQDRKLGSEHDCAQ